MSTEIATKINQLLAAQPAGVVLLAGWLEEQGYSRELQKRYKKSQWLEAIGSGAMIRKGDSVNYQGAIYALQQQLKLTLHPGGKTALALSGKSHYLEMASTRVLLFGQRDEKLPLWFKKQSWGVKINYYSSSFLPGPTGLADMQVNSFSIKISSPARAMMECLYLAPKDQELVECYEIMEGLNNLRPTLVQELLEECSSIKVKRLFLYMAEKAGHSWLQYLDVNKIDLGKGKRSILPNGVYIPKYQITVPKELEENGIPSV